jgi:hypothetical protein
MKKKTGRDWEFRVSRKFMDREDLTGYAKWLAVCLRGWANKDGFAQPTMPQISKRCGFSIDTVDKYLAELKAKEVVEWVNFRDDLGHNRRRYFLGKKLPIALGDATPYGHGGHTPPLTGTISTSAEENSTLYDYDLNFAPRRAV